MGPKNGDLEPCGKHVSNSGNSGVRHGLEPNGPNSENFQIIYNIHYHEIVGGDSVALCNSIKNDIDLCATDPINANLVLSGDFNLTSTIGKAYSFSDPVPVASVDTRKTPCTGNGKLQELLLRLTEVEAGLPTRYNSSTDKGTTIDRIFTNLPSYLFPITKWEVNTGCCKETYFKILSDHAILSEHVSFKEVCQYETGKISEVVSRHPKFGIYIEIEPIIEQRLKRGENIIFMISFSESDLKIINEIRLIE